MESSGSGDWNIKILDNDFSGYTDENYKNIQEKGMRYINVNVPFFESREFVNLSSGAMLLAIDFYRQTMASFSRTEFGTITRNVEKFFGKYTEKLNHFKRSNEQLLNRRVVQNYLKEIKKFFNIHIQNGNYKIKLKDKFLKKLNYATERTSSIYIKHIKKTLIRRLKINVNDSDELDLENTIFVYVNTLKTRLKQAIVNKDISLQKVKKIVAFEQLQEQIKLSFQQCNHIISDKVNDWKIRNWNIINKYVTKQLHNSIDDLICT